MTTPDHVDTLRAVLTAEAADIDADAARLRYRAAIGSATRPRRRFRGPRRLRIIAPVLSVAVVALVVSLVVVAVGSTTRHHGGPTAATHPVSPPARVPTAFPAGSLAGRPNLLQVDPLPTTRPTYVHTTNYDVVDLDTVDGATMAAITGYVAGAFDPWVITGAQHIQIGGHDALIGQATSPYAASSENIKGKVLTVAWQAAGGRWITVQGWSTSSIGPLQGRSVAAMVRQVAATARLAGTPQLRLPFRLTSLAAPAQLSNGFGYLDDKHLDDVQGYSDSGLPSAQVNLSLPNGERILILVAQTPIRSSGPHPLLLSKKIGQLYVTVVGSGSASHAQVVAVLNSVRLVDNPTNLANWLPVSA